MDNRQYVILDSEKKPLHEFKRGGKRWEEVKDFAHIGLIIPAPFIVLDFDSASESQLILKIIDAVGLKCKAMKTTRGVHIWLKSAAPWKNFVKCKLAVGLIADCRSHGKSGYVKIKDSGVLREWIRDCPDEDIDEVPRWLYPAHSSGDRFNFVGMKSGDGRNQELYNYILHLQGKGFTRDEIRETITLINNHLFAEPLRATELSTILRDESFKPEAEIQQNGGKPVHNLVAEELLQEYKIITVDKILYLYSDGYYKPALDLIEQEIIRRYPDVKQLFRKEVLEYIKLKTLIRREDIKSNPYVINLQNCRLNISTGRILDYTPDSIEFERVPVTYDSGAACDDIDRLLDKVFGGDQEVVELFEEMLGDCLLRKNIYQKAFIFYGTGSNGKSTILKLIRRLLGNGNVSTMGLDQLTRDFNGAELENKLANIGDDMNYKPIKDSGTLKKLFSGEPLTVSRKFQAPFTLEPYATHIFSCNEIPRNSDRSEGMSRRWCFVPFIAVFSKSDPDYDPLIFDKVSTDQALSHLLNRAIRGFQRLQERGYYQEPKVVTEAMRAYAVVNNSVLSWIEDAEITLDYILETPKDTLYKLYLHWCNDNRIKEAAGSRTFYKEIIREYKLSNTCRQRRSDGKRYFTTRIDF